jgi:predicted transcriptional regulator
MGAEQNDPRRPLMPRTTLKFGKILHSPKKNIIHWVLCAVITRSESQRIYHVKDKPYYAFSIGIDPEMARDVSEIASLLGVQPHAIVADALDDWMRCIAPVRLEDALAILDGGTAPIRGRSVQPDSRAGQEGKGRCRLPACR